MLLQVCGTPTYVAPEILAETGYGVKVDVWATGVIMYILLVGFPPFSSRTNNQEELFDQILSGLFEFNSPDWDDISFSAKELISWMLQVDPLQRFSAYEILEHPVYIIRETQPIHQFGFSQGFQGLVSRKCMQIAITRLNKNVVVR